MVSVRAIDGTGNVDMSPDSHTCTVDAPPDTSIQSGPSGVTASRDASFAFAADEPARFECRLDGSTFTGCSSLTPYSGLADGTHRFEVRAIDETGKTDPTPAERTWTVDTIPPETLIQSGPSGLVNRRDAVVGFGASEPGSSFQCSLDDGAMAPCSSPRGIAGLGDGSHTVRVRAIDAAGNSDPDPAAHSWTVDATPPRLAIRSPAAGQAVSDATPTLAGTAGTARDDAGTVTVRLYAGALAEGTPARTLSAALDGATGAWSTSAGRLADGTWTVRAEQSDAAGNPGASAPVTFRVDTTPPGFVLAPAEEHLAGALARGVPIFAGCASACRVSATLSLSAAKARALGLRAGRRSLASLAATLARGAAGHVRLAGVARGEAHATEARVAEGEAERGRHRRRGARATAPGGPPRTHRRPETHRAARTSAPSGMLGVVHGERSPRTPRGERAPPGL